MDALWTGLGFAAAIAVWLVQVAALFLLSTFVFDVVHWLLHVFARSRLRALRAIGSLHETHHRFLPRDLRVRDELIPANLRHHVIPEYLTHLAVSAAWLWLAPLPVVLGAVAIQTATVAYILSQRGQDVNHRSREQVRAYAPSYLCAPSYHALHHAHPDAHYAAYLKTFDHLMGTGTSLAGRSVALVGADTPLGAALAAALRRHAVSALVEIGAARSGDALELEGSDIVVLLHGAVNPALGSGAAAERIERFAERAKARRLPAELWAAGSELELAGAGRGDPARAARAAAAREFALRARSFYADRRFLYRHLVLPEPAGPRGFGQLSPRAAARMALFFVRRGFRYVPVSATGLAFANYLRFRYALAAEPGPRLAPRAV